jgi:hypothetical protein
LPSPSLQALKLKSTVPRLSVVITMCFWCPMGSSLVSDPS